MTLDRRLFRMDFRDRVAGVWDESIPIVRQWILEGVGIHDSLLNNESVIVAAAEKLCAVLDVNVIERFVHPFSPHGFTVIFLLSESHIAIHTWPERRYVHVDIVTCKKTKVDISLLSDAFDEMFAPSHCRGYSVKY